jgi:4-amino-4-deoxy-L-arabinose transferase-like glycosyltransferase
LTRRLLLAVAGVALAVRVAALVALGPERAFYPDALEYEAVAKHLLADGAYVDGLGLRARRPPLYPVFLALHGGSYAVARWSQALLGAAMCAAVALLARRVSGRAAWIAGLACAVHPLLAYVSAASLAESVGVPFAVLEALLLVAAVERRSWRWALGAGAAGAAATLGAAAHQPVFALLAVGAWRLAKDWRPAAAYAAVAALVPALWMARNAAVVGTFAMTTQGGVAFYEAFGPDATGGINVAAVQAAERSLADRSELGTDRGLRALAWRSVGESPGRAAALALPKQARFWSPVPNFGEYRSGWMIAVTALTLVPTTLGLLASLALVRRWPAPVVIAGLAVLATALLHLVFIGSIRYRLAVEPFIVVMGAFAAARWRSEAPAAGPR